MSFIGDMDDTPSQEDINEVVESGNKKLLQQMQEINVHQEEIISEGVNIDPFQIMWLRLQHIMDIMIPPDMTENNTIGNPERINSEVEWNAKVIDFMKNGLSQIRQQKLMSGINANPDGVAKMMEQMKNGDMPSQNGHVVRGLN